MMIKNYYAQIQKMSFHFVPTDDKITFRTNKLKECDLNEPMKVLIKIKDQSVLDDLAKLDISCNTRIATPTGEIITIYIPRQLLEKVEKLPGVISIEYGRSVHSN